MHDCITEESGAKLEGVIRVDESEIRSHVDEVVRQSVEETLNGLLEAEADQLCQGVLGGSRANAIILGGYLLRDSSCPCP